MDKEKKKQPSAPLIYLMYIFNVTSYIKYKSNLLFFYYKKKTKRSAAFCFIQTRDLQKWNLLYCSRTHLMFSKCMWEVHTKDSFSHTEKNPQWRKMCVCDVWTPNKYERGKLRVTDTFLKSLHLGEFRYRFTKSLFAWCTVVTVWSVKLMTFIRAGQTATKKNPFLIESLFIRGRYYDHSHLQLIKNSIRNAWM